MKPLNLLAFLLGLSLAFIPFSSYAATACYPNTSGAMLTACNAASAGEVFWTQAWSPMSGCDIENAGTYNYIGTGNYSFTTSITYDRPTCEPLPPPEPAYCFDGLLSPYETGIDCGGECSAVCTDWCGGDYQLIDGICVAQSLPDSFGNCASGYTLDPAGMCVAWSDPIVANEGYTPNDLTPFLTDHFDNVPIDNDIETTVSTVDNGDGTSTITTTTTIINNTSNTSSTSTETTNIDNSTGATISSSIVVSGEKPQEENPNNYNYQVDYGDTPVFDSDISSDIPEKTEMSGIIDNFIANFPLFSVLDNQSMSLENTVCAAPAVNIYGTDLTISLCRWEDFLKSLGVIFVIVAQSAAVFIVIRGWKAS